MMMLIFAVSLVCTVIGSTSIETKDNLIMTLTEKVEGLSQRLQSMDQNLKSVDRRLLFQERRMRKLEERNTNKYTDDLLNTETLDKEDTAHPIPGVKLSLAQTGQAAVYARKLNSQWGGNMFFSVPIVTEVNIAYNSVARNFLLLQKGMYFFHLNILTPATTDNTEVHIREDLTQITRAWAGGKHHSAGSASVVKEFEAGAQISCAIIQGGVWGHFTDFSGFMLYAIE